MGSRYCRVLDPRRCAVGSGRKPSLLVEPEIGTGAVPQRSAQLRPQRLRVSDGALAVTPDLAAAVRFQEQPFDHQSVAVELREPSDRGAAGAVEGGEHCALGANAGAGSRVMKRLEELPQRLVSGAAFESECALTHRREHDFARQDLGRKLSLAEPFEAAQREHQRIDLTGVQLADPRVYIASDRKDLQIRASPQ